MRNSKIWAWVISIITFILGVLVTLALKDSGDSSKVVPWAENVVLITSFIISFVAFIFSMITYFSIDSVSNVTAMDGNVLENADYAIAYEEMIDNFKDKKTRKDFTDTLFKIVTCPRRTKSCMAFADRLQRILDHIIWFAYVEMNNDDVKKECSKIVKRIKKEAGRYNRLSNGIRYQLDENVKMIEYILLYQQIRSEEKYYEFSKLENIRGKMLKNPISQILYYDYLGLDYRRKAANILRACGDTNKEFEVDHMRAIMNYTYTEEQRKQFDCLLDRAEQCFEKAQEMSKENILWEGYISYNTIRVQLMKYLMREDVSSDNLLLELDKIIRIRENAAYLFKRDGAYLDTCFDDEVERAKALKENFEALLQSEVGTENIEAMFIETENV